MRVGLLGFVLSIGAPITSTGCTFLAPSDTELYGPDAGGPDPGKCPPDWCAFDAGADFKQVTFEKGLTDGETGANSASDSIMWIGEGQALHCNHSASISGNSGTEKSFVAVSLGSFSGSSATDLYISFYVKLPSPGPMGPQPFVTFQPANDLVARVGRTTISLKNGGTGQSLEEEKEAFVGLHLRSSGNAEFIVRKDACGPPEEPETTTNSLELWDVDFENTEVRIGNAGNDGTIAAVIDDIRISTVGFEDFSR